MTTDNTDLYSKHIFVERLHVPFVSVGTNIEYILKDILVEKLEGKCNKDGFIKPDSIRILSISNGEIQSDYAIFYVTLECLLCFPVEGMKMHVKATNITKAGIRAISADYDLSPFNAFIARDHNYMKKEFTSLVVGQTFYVKVIGARFEIFDTTISILADIETSTKSTPIVIQDEAKYNDDTDDEENEENEKNEENEENL